MIPILIYYEYRRQEISLSGFVRAGRLEAKLHLRRQHGFHRGNTIADMWAVYNSVKDDPRVLTLRAEDILGPGGFDEFVRRMLSHLLGPSLRMGPGLWRQIRSLAARFDESRCGRCIPTPSAQTTEGQRRLKRRARQELATLRRSPEVRKLVRMQRELGYEEEEEVAATERSRKKRSLLGAECCPAGASASTARHDVSELWSLKFKDPAELRSVLLQKAASCTRRLGHVVFVDWGLDWEKIGGRGTAPPASSTWLPLKGFLASLAESPLHGACISSHLRCGVIERVWSLALHSYQTPQTPSALPAMLLSCFRPFRKKEKRPKPAGDRGRQCRRRPLHDFVAASVARRPPTRAVRGEVGEGVGLGRVACSPKPVARSLGIPYSRARRAQFHSVGSSKNPLQLRKWKPLAAREYSKPQNPLHAETARTWRTFSILFKPTGHCKTPCASAASGGLRLADLARPSLFPVFAAQECPRPETAVGGWAGP